MHLFRVPLDEQNWQKVWKKKTKRGAEGWGETIMTEDITCKQKDQ